MYSEKEKGYICKAFAYASPDIEDQLHRSHSYRVKFNNNPRYPIIESIINEVKTGTAIGSGVWGKSLGIIDSQTNVGGWPELKTYNVPADLDHDGMADNWELQNGLDPKNPEDRNDDNNGDGYTNVEKYINRHTTK